MKEALASVHNINWLIQPLDTFCFAFYCWTQCSTILRWIDRQLVYKSLWKTVTLPLKWKWSEQTKNSFRIWIDVGSGVHFKCLCEWCFYWCASRSLSLSCSQHGTMNAEFLSIYTESFRHNHCRLYCFFFWMTLALTH